MNIKIIDEKEQFAQCETFEITHLLWGTKAIPKTYGKAGKICFFLPLELLEEIGGPIPQIAGTKIACNFYKVCEGGNAEQIHYASYSPVDVPEPDFHRPEFFETGELQ